MVIYSHFAVVINRCRKVTYRCAGALLSDPVDEEYRCFLAHFGTVDDEDENFRRLRCLLLVML